MTIKIPALKLNSDSNILVTKIRHFSNIASVKGHKSYRAVKATYLNLT